MGYKPLEYQKLQMETDTLLSSFNNLCRRYIPLTYDKLRERVSLLESKYEGIKNKWTSNFNLRRHQLACIDQLLSKLPEKGSFEVINQAQNIQLGAIFYRYKRIELSYSPYLYKPYFFLSKGPKNSALFQILQKEFNLDQLDDETLATCCEAYKSYLEQADNSIEGGGRKIGDLFPYIQKDPDFYINLNKIITDARRRAAPITFQLHVIAFVQSVSKALQKTDKIILKILPQLVTSALQQLEKEPSLTRQHLIGLLALIQSSPEEEVATEVLKMILPKEIFSEGVILNDTPEEMIPFSDYLYQALNVSSNYTLLGAYVLALNKCTSNTSQVRDALNAAINSMGSNQLDDKSKILALTALKRYTDIQGIPALDCRAWRDEVEGYMKMDLDNQLNQLRNASNRVEVPSLEVEPGLGGSV